MNTPSGQDLAEIVARLNRIESALARNTGATHSGAIDLRDLVLALWKGKWPILAGTVLSGMIAITLALRIPDQYEATAILMPASTTSAASLSRLAGQLGGLASLAGLNLNVTDEANDVVAAMALIRSWGFLEQFVRENQLEVALVAAKGWDRETNRLLIDPEVYDTEQQKWVRAPRDARRPNGEPTSWEIYERLSERISISEDPDTGLIELSVEFYSPYLAKEWVDKLVVAVNKHLQERDRVEAEKSIRYLEDRMNETSLLEIKTVFSRLIEEQVKNLMLARVNEEYVLKTLSPAKVPERKSRPQRALICLMTTSAGAFASTVIWLLWFGMRRVSPSPTRRDGEIATGGTGRRRLF